MKQTYGSIGVEAICNEAGVKKGSFYYFFESKAHLAIAALEDHWERYLPEMEKTFSPEIDPLERLFRYFEGVYLYNLNRKKAGKEMVGCPYFLIGTEMIRGNEEILQVAHGILSKYFSFFRKVVVDASRMGEVSPTLDPEAAARYIFAFFEGTLTLSCIHNDPEDLADLIPGARRILGLVN
jgi:TetR/AcrR family transcriptional repressor of nem operon